MTTADEKRMPHPADIAAKVINDWVQTDAHRKIYDSDASAELKTRIEKAIREGEEYGALMERRSHNAETDAERKRLMNLLCESVSMLRKGPSKNPPEGHIRLDDGRTVKVLGHRVTDDDVSGRCLGTILYDESGPEIPDSLTPADKINKVEPDQYITLPNGKSASLLFTHRAEDYRTKATFTTLYCIESLPPEPPIEEDKKQPVSLPIEDLYNAALVAWEFVSKPIPVPGIEDEQTCVWESLHYALKRFNPEFQK